MKSNQATTLVIVILIQHGFLGKRGNFLLYGDTSWSRGHANVVLPLHSIISSCNYSYLLNLILLNKINKKSLHHHPSLAAAIARHCFDYFVFASISNIHLPPNERLSWRMRNRLKHSSLNLRCIIRDSTTGAPLDPIRTVNVYY